MKLACTNFTFCKRRVLYWLLNSCRPREYRRSLSQRKVLGIETSCDDTGAAVVDEMGEILGESLNSQSRLSVE